MNRLNSEYEVKFMAEEEHSVFYFKKFEVKQTQCAMKVGTDAVLLGAWVACSSAKYILDIGTGTGLLALMVAQRSQAVIDAIDIDMQAYMHAKENFEASQWRERLHVKQCSVQTFADIANRKYDLIISNPPFFMNAHKSSFVERNVARHFNETLTMVELIQAVIKLLTTDGSFSLILPVKEGGLLIEEGERQGLFVNEIIRVRTKFGKAEKRMLLRFSKVRSKIKTDTLSIQSQDGKYSDEYIQLTREFYTHLPERL